MLRSQTFPVCSLWVQDQISPPQEIKNMLFFLVISYEIQQKWIAGTCNKYMFLISGRLKRLTESREVNKWFEKSKKYT
jgi:hypothetical protein